MYKDKKSGMRERIENDEDFIYCPRLSNSLNSLLKVHPNGVENDRISKVLLISEDEVESIFQRAIKKFRKILNISVKED